MKIYLLHGTGTKGFKGIGDGRASKQGLVKGGQVRVASSPGGKSWLGKGVYCTTSYKKARAYGEYVYLLEFEVQKLKMVNEWDKPAAWRKDAGVGGVYMPPRTKSCQKAPKNEDEFCMRRRTLKRVWLVSRPGDSQVVNGKCDCAANLGSRLCIRAKIASRFPRNVDVDKLCSK